MNQSPQNVAEREGCIHQRLCESVITIEIFFIMPITKKPDLNKACVICLAAELKKRKKKKAKHIIFYPFNYKNI